MDYESGLIRKEVLYGTQSPAHRYFSHAPSRAPGHPGWRCWPGRLASGLAVAPERCGPEAYPERPDDLGRPRHPGAVLVGSVGDPRPGDALYAAVCGARRPAQAHARQLHVPLTRYEVERERGRPDV